MRTVMRGALLALVAGLALAATGCETIEARYLSVNESAYQVVGVEFVELVNGETARPERQAALAAALDGAAAVVSAQLATVEATPGHADAEVTRLTAIGAGLAAARAHLPTLTPGQAQRRADSVSAWRAALMEARHHQGGGEDAATAMPPLPDVPAPSPGDGW